MTPKEKAIELVDKFNNAQYNGCVVCGNSINYQKEQLHFAKQCALIAVNEKLNEHTFYNPVDWSGMRTKRIEFLNQVKKEIEQLP